MRTHALASAAAMAALLGGDTRPPDDHVFVLNAPEEQARYPSPKPKAVAPAIPRRYRLAKYAPCPCGSGKKQHYCCGKRGAK